MVSTIVVSSIVIVEDTLLIRILAGDSSLLLLLEIRPLLIVAIDSCSSQVLISTGLASVKV